MFDNFDTIYIYTRKQALNDGQQFCVSELFSKIKTLLDIHFYFTSSIWNLCPTQLDREQFAWNICIKVIFNAQKNPEQSLIDLSNNINNKEHTVWAEIGATDIDNPQPAITVMFPEEH